MQRPRAEKRRRQEHDADPRQAPAPARFRDRDNLFDSALAQFAQAIGARDEILAERQQRCDERQHDQRARAGRELGQGSDRGYSCEKSGKKQERSERGGGDDGSAGGDTGILQCPRRRIGHAGTFHHAECNFVGQKQRDGQPGEIGQR
jgi:hypothetical protein